MKIKIKKYRKIIYMEVVRREGKMVEKMRKTPQFYHKWQY